MIRRIVVATAALCALLLTSAVFAADHSADFYKRTGTHPPASASYDGFLGPRVTVAEGPGLGIAGGFLAKKPGVLVLFSVDAVAVNGVSGTVAPDCIPTLHVPYSTPDRTVAVFGFSALWRIKAPK